jgi:hypothetical protein
MMRPAVPQYLPVFPPAAVEVLGVNDRMFVENGELPPGYVRRVDAPDALAIQTTENQAVKQTQQLAAQTVASKGSGAVPTRASAAQAVINTGGSPAHAAIADAIAANNGRAVVAVPPAYAGSPAYVDAHRAQSSVQNYWWPPTFVSTVTPVTSDAHAVSIAATAAARTL